MENSKNMNFHEFCFTPLWKFSQQNNLSTSDIYWQNGASLLSFKMALFFHPSGKNVQISLNTIH